MTAMALDRHGFAALIRPRILLLVLAQTGAGYMLARPDSLAALPWVVLGTALVSMAGCSLNHYLEREADARMTRTRLRPLVTGALSPRQVVGFGLTCLVAGLLVLQLGCGPLPMLIEALAAVLYLGVYTPLKRRTSTNTWVGAIPGALPLLAGAAAGGELNSVAFIAAALVFLWQLPHFFAIASLYREQYRSGGMRMLSGDDPDDALLRWQMPMQVMSVVLVSVLPILEGQVRVLYALTAVVLGAVFLWAALRFRRRAGEAEARGVVRASVLYLPLVLGALVLDTACTPHADLDDHDHATGPAEVADCCAAEAGAAALAAAEPCCAEEGTDAACCNEAAGEVAEAGARSGSGTASGADADTGSESAPAIAAAADGEVAADAAPGSPNLSRLPPGIREVDGAVAASLDDGTGLPAFGAVPEFSLFSESGAPFGRADMLGDVWIVDFIFTRCAGICVPMSRAIVDMQEEGLDTRFLSVTVDPGYDSPAVLAGYREKWDGADSWTLLTGSTEIITDLSEQGFALPVQTRRETPVEGMPQIFHSGKFALVDAEGRVRGYYAHDDRLEMQQLREDVAALRGAAADG